MGTSVDARGDAKAGELLAQSPMVLVVLGHDGRIAMATGRFVVEVLGAAGPYVGQVISELPDIATILPDLVGRALEGSESVGRLALVDGSLQIRVTPSVDAAGVVTGAVVLGAPELAQASSDEAFMRLFRASPVPISVSTLETGIFSHCNDAFVRSFEYPREEVVGRGSVELGMWSPEQRLAAITELKEKGVLVSHESTVRTKSGEIRDVVFNMERIEFAGRFHLVGFFYDITERKRAEEEQRRLYQQLKELDELKGQFIANVSHELRTPLTLIVGLAERLAAGAPRSEREARDLQGIQRNGRLLLKQVNDLLYVARLDAGRSGVRYAAVDIATELRVFASIFDVLAHDKGIVYTIDAPPTLPVQIDPDKFERIATNLLSNAFKFTPRGGEVQCTLSVSGAHLLLRVSDSGPGISPEHRDSVFERFFQVEGGATRVHGGTGLGLAIVRGLVESLHGTIGVTASPSGGACFEVNFPVTAPEGTVVAATRGSQVSGLERAIVTDITAGEAPVVVAPEPGDDGRGLVLVVEDNAEMARFVAESLSDTHRVVTASNGEEGLARARQLRPDVVLSDVMMPRMSGDVFVAALRKEPGLEGVRVVLLTARADEAFRARMLTDGAHDFITKPFSVVELKARVAHQVFVKQRDDARLKAAHENERVMERLAKELQQVQKMEAIGRLAGGVAHDFNNLLTVIGGYATLLVDTPAEPSLVQELAREIKDASDRAAALTRQLLTFGRKQVVNPVVTDPNETILGLQKMFQHLAGDTVALTFELSSEPCLVRVDPTQLDQVLINLVMNARDAMPRGGRITVRTTTIICDATADCLLFGADLPPGDYVSLEVRDTGTGVSDEAIEHIFEPFYTTKDFGKGTGLGLAIVHGIVQQNGGRIMCESQVGQGTLFRIVLPRVRGAADIRHAPDSTAHTATTGRRILVVDDDDGVREFVVRRLNYLGFEVVVATSGVDAVRQVDAGLAPVDLVITDVAMPELDGRGLAARLGEHWPTVPILFVSGYMDDGPFRDALQGNVVRLLEKPFTAAELERVVNMALASDNQ